MHIDTDPNRGSRPTILLHESFREDGKVKKRTLANGTWNAISRPRSSMTKCPAANHAKAQFAKAKRSKRAPAKAASKCADDGEPVHSFGTLLSDLSTLCRLTVRSAIPEAQTFSTPVSGKQSPIASDEMRFDSFLGRVREPKL